MGRKAADALGVPAAGTRVTPESRRRWTARLHVPGPGDVMADPPGPMVCPGRGRCRGACSRSRLGAGTRPGRQAARNAAVSPTPSTTVPRWQLALGLLGELNGTGLRPAAWVGRHGLRCDAGFRNGLEDRRPGLRPCRPKVRWPPVAGTPSPSGPPMAASVPGCCCVTAPARCSCVGAGRRPPPRSDPDLVQELQGRDELALRYLRVRLAKSRRRIGHDCRELTTCLGRPDLAGRSFTGRHRHVTSSPPPTCSRPSSRPAQAPARA